MSDIRIVHLWGGTRAINNPGSEVIIFPRTTDNQTAQFNLPNYNSLLSVLKSLNFNIIGIDYYSSPEEIQGVYPPEWHSFSRIKSPNYPLNDSTIAWSNISFSASQVEDYLLSDVAGRISFGLQACESRLRDISESYNKELRALCDDGNFKDGNYFETRHTFNIYLSIHSFLIEACCLRDYLAEFMRIFVFDTYRDQKITTMAGLRKHILRKLHDKNSFASNLYEATDTESSNGWIATLGEYRDLVVHSMPLAHARVASFIFQTKISICNDKYFPSITLPLPTNPGEIFKKRSQGILFSGYDEWFRAFQEDIEKSKNSPDALQYCCDSYDKIIHLATTLLQYSPIKPKTPVIRPEDIVRIEQ